MLISTHSQVIDTSYATFARKMKQDFMSPFWGWVENGKVEMRYFTKEELQLVEDLVLAMAKNKRLRQLK